MTIEQQGADSPHDPAQLRQRRQRLAASVLSRRTLSASLVLSMAVDFLFLESSSLQTPITALQSALLLLAALVAARPPPRSFERRLQQPRHTALYLAGAATIALTALAQKWWIALREQESVSYDGSYRVMGAALTLAGVLALIGRERRLARYFAAFAEQPARQTALSFVGLSVFGGFLLSLPICVRSPSQVSFLDALFMATSAVCVTGLSVFDIASQYTIWGQGVLLALVQMGGLGIMVLSASLIVLTGRKLKARSSAVLTEMLDTESVASLHGSIKRIVLFTLTLEALGAALLYTALARHPDVALDFTHVQPMAGAGSLAWASIFHAVSAFCNAGFTLTRTNLIPFASSHYLCSIIMALTVLGSLGFPVLSELTQRLVARLRRERPPRLSLHTRVVLTLSGALIVLVALLASWLEWSQGLAALPRYERPFGALFHSVILRSSGFNTVDIGSFSSAGLMLCMMFMFVGGSPGGTGGGIKITTFAVLFATLRAELRGHDEPSLFDRRLPAGTVRRAISVAFVAVVVLTLSVFLLLLCENADALRLAFEAVSAFGTVGLSTNLTPTLGSRGKLIIIATMLIGRVGPLTVALAASERGKRAHHLRPQERVLIG